MSVLCDTSFLLAARNLRDANHDRAVQLLRELLRGEHGRPHVTDFIFAEAVTIALARTNRHSAAVGMGDMLQQERDGRRLFTWHHVTPAQVDTAWAELRRHADKALSMTDWMSIVVARELELDAILSFDEGFDGLFPRLR